MTKVCQSLPQIGNWQKTEKKSILFMNIPEYSKKIHDIFEALDEFYHPMESK